MHSSIINKIRILKPRKKVDSQQTVGVAKSFTINNDNCHASLVLKDKIANDNPPPLEPPPTNESKEPSTSKWVPFYFVNVPKDNEKRTDLSNDSTTTNKVSDSEVKESSLKTSEHSSETVHSNLNTVPRKVIKTMRLRSVLGKERVTCFLCPEMFDSVQNMQEHYFQNHKNKKKLANSNNNNNGNNNNNNNNNNNTNSNSIKTNQKKGQRNLKPKDPLKITEEDTSTGDGEPKCPICSIYFKTKDEVKSHMTNVHCYKCSECHNTFYTLYQFTDHRCTKYVKQKKAKLKKKVKTVSGNKDSPANSVSNNQYNFVKIQPKTVQVLPSTSYPVIFNYPSEKQVLYTQPQGAGSQIISNNNRQIAKSNSDVKNSANKYSHQSLLNCTLEELTSKDFIKMKLEEIIKNPHLSVNLIPKTNPENNDVDQEFFSCGRCNVLCEDKSDYIEHLEECLRLSNVSIFESSSSERILKLKTEVIPQRNNQSSKTTINKTLLKELQNFIEPENLDIFNSVEENTSLQNNTDTVINNNNSNNNNNIFTHPDIKGNISITKINSTNNSGPLFSAGALSNMGIPKQHTQNVPIQILQSNQNENLTAFLGTKQTLTSQQPMVLIPLNNALQANSMTLRERDFDSPDYPNISITDKSNSVTWNFIGSESGSILRVESPFQKNIPVRVDKSNSFVTLKNKNFVQLPMLSAAVISPNNINVPAMSSTSNVPSQEPDLIKPKEEPVSPNPSMADTPSPTFNEMKDNYSSMELVLDEEEIKMEVEEEVVDDKF